MVTMLTASGLTLRLGRRTILDDAGFTARRGAVTGLIGPNGVGKSTLLRAVAGLLPHGGDVRFDGQPLPADAGSRARLLGYLPQGHPVHWPLTVRRTVALGRLPHLGPFGRAGRLDEDAVERVMAATGVAGLAARAVPTLSGGERARVMLARVLAADAPVLLADEPTAALDPGHQLRIMALLRAEAVERQRAVVVVLHDLSLAARCCDDLVLLMPDRRVIAGDAATVLTPSLLGEAYGVAFAVTRAADVPVVLPQCPTPIPDIIQSGD
ncbi:ABC transporter ATP-binding protein (plasmid) [Azospirillum humicireducens]|uniref:ABC transporter ATP-binding protein n=2 Tax=Azospirillum humicireducens TaxID=1226968 RepID=A0A2R4VV73_9PROT|nr:ABC transporter ATP-binding protein [Azospirillum humicireducens]